jgi:3-dehydroquinate synthase
MTLAFDHTDPSAPKTGDPVIVPVELGQRRYNITIGPGLMLKADQFLAPILTGRQVVIIADEAVATPWLEQLEIALNRITDCHHVMTAGGESAKSFSRYTELMENILNHGITRQTVIIALGGGVIGDLAGFMAASLLRGLDYIQIPTTLLSQVDSSVGGKTGINASAGKNLVGAFHQPRAVLIDTDCLSTLPDREMRAGYAEVVKYGLLGHADFFDWLEEHGAAVLKREPYQLVEAIRRCCQAKADIVAADETENGIRALLNLGHTFAHAFEAEAGYDGRLLHGEAVAAGLGHAFALSRRLGFIDGQSCHRVAKHLEAMGLANWRHGLPADMANANIDQLIRHMAKEKKAQSRELVFVLVRAIGDAFVEKGIKPQEIAAVLAAANMDDALS